MSAPVMEPSACTWCGIAQRGHGRQYADAVGWHGWEQPSQEQILARMKARRLQLAVAQAGAFPVPMGGERTLDVVEEELTGVNLALWEGIEAYARLRLALASAQRGRRELRSQVAALLVERHSTNESLDDAVQALRADRDRIVELERMIAEAPASYALMERARVEADEAAGAPDFFRPGRTYLRFVGDRELYFRVTSISTDNPNRSDSLAGDGPVAYGWSRTERSTTVWGPTGQVSFVGWHDVTDGGGS